MFIQPLAFGNTHSQYLAEPAFGAGRPPVGSNFQNILNPRADRVEITSSSRRAARSQERGETSSSSRSRNSRSRSPRGEVKTENTDRRSRSPSLKPQEHLTATAALYAIAEHPKDIQKRKLEEEFNLLKDEARTLFTPRSESAADLNAQYSKKDNPAMKPFLDKVTKHLNRYSSPEMDQERIPELKTIVKEVSQEQYKTRNANRLNRSSLILTKDTYNRDCFHGPRRAKEIQPDLQLQASDFDEELLRQHPIENHTRLNDLVNRSYNTYGSVHEAHRIQRITSHQPVPEEQERNDYTKAEQYRRNWIRYSMGINGSNNKYFRPTFNCNTRQWT